MRQRPAHSQHPPVSAPRPSVHAPHTPKQPRVDPATEAIRRRSLWQSFTSIPAQQRLWLSIGFMVFAYAGLRGSDQLEAKYPNEPPIDLRKTREEIALDHGRLR
ncbi:uncharacterized protein L969DRAFT_102297 [Mixia osmundae IAM 14324]|uniref:Uncharacterized protein n=1 Tax=Mixia osmundae (strain CBS 9802 / IAM 14324 / JCM 22182 / KY 12970) TaxID=764103 RepID=G7E5A3_MIXOS|nr:uncharacterized protein L969DRAFT_102297 [Mixia osmundae IAM 14324]KEI40838.1 hypothetical protein L969DRAFT_102297 [Mixia osmundae IAM 14324]GAA98013.1 hypothetical protein E5Q_04693 [Mixia osmundae IAM 14324]